MCSLLHFNNYLHFTKRLVQVLMVRRDRDSAVAEMVNCYLTLYCLCSNISVPHEHSPWMNSTVIKSVLNERSVVRKMIKTFPFTMFTMRKVVLVNNICQSNCGCEFPVNMAKLVAGHFWNLRFVFCSHFRRELFRRNICTGYDIMPPEKDPPPYEMRLVRGVGRN